MSEYKFSIPKIETRTKEMDGRREFIIKGYATVPNHIYSYGGKQDSDGKITPFREFFTENAIKNMQNKAKKQNVFVDIGHQVASKFNIKSILNDIKSKTSADISEESDYILKRIRDADVPMFKVNDVIIDDKGLLVDIRGNPYYREIDTEHQQYFDSVWKSLEEGYINGMSLNFNATDVVNINDSLRKINDVDIYGISLANGAANDVADIIQVATRCMNDFVKVGGDSSCQKQKTSLLML